MKNNAEQINFKAHTSYMFNKFINITKCLHIRRTLRNFNCVLLDLVDLCVILKYLHFVFCTNFAYSL